MAKAGRTSAADEKKKKAFRDRLPKLGAKAREADVMAYVQRVTDGYLKGLLSAVELENLQKSASIALRALRQRHSRLEIEELEKLLADSKKIRATARSKGAAERNRTH